MKTFKKPAYAALVIFLVSITLFCLYLYNIGESDFLVPPPPDNYAVVIHISKKADVESISKFRDAIQYTVFPGSYSHGSWLRITENKDYVFLRINRHYDLSPVDAEKHLSRIVSDANLDGYVEYAVIEPENMGGVLRSGSFRPEVFP